MATGAFQSSSSPPPSPSACPLTRLSINYFSAYNFVEAHEQVTPFPIALMGLGGILAVVSLLAVVCTNRCCLCIVDIFTWALLLLELALVVTMLIPPARAFIIGEVPDEIRNLLTGRLHMIIGLAFAVVIGLLQLSTLLVSCCYGCAAKKEAYDDLDDEEDRAAARMGRYVHTSLGAFVMLV